jgi:TolB-like protein
MALDDALQINAVYLAGKIPASSNIVILNIESDSPSLSAYIIDELTSRIIDDGRLVVIDRNRGDLEALEKESNFQLSGEVSDETAISIGKKIGAQTIVFGSIKLAGAVYILKIRAIDVETTRIQGSKNTDVGYDGKLIMLSSDRTYW